MPHEITGLKFDIEFLEKVRARSPSNQSVLRALAEAQSQEGNFAQALALDEALVALRPTDCVALYNFACSLSRVERVEDAIEALKRAVAHGYRDLEHLMQDDDLDAVRRRPEFLEFAKSVDWDA